MISTETRDRLDELVATLSRDEPANSEDAKEIAADITAILAELDRLEGEMLEDLRYLGHEREADELEEYRRFLVQNDPARTPTPKTGEG